MGVPNPPGQPPVPEPPPMPPPQPIPEPPQPPATKKRPAQCWPYFFGFHSRANRKWPAQCWSLNLSRNQQTRSMVSTVVATQCSDNTI